MANINLYEVYLNKVRKFAVNDSSRFRGSFVEAVNNVYGEMNDQVFQSESLEYISSFDDIMDKRLASFITIELDSVVESDRDYWAIEYWLERKASTNGLTDTIADDESNVVISIADDVLTVAGDTVVATADISEVDNIMKIRFESNQDGNSLSVNGDSVSLTYTTGDSETVQAIGTVSSHVISGVSGFELLRLRFLSAGTLIYDFDINEGTGTELTSLVSIPSDSDITDLTATVDTPVWKERFIEASTTLSNRYLAPFSMGVEYHLQEGGEWAIEPAVERERKWYGRGIKQARNVYQQTTTFSNPLGI